LSRLLSTTSTNNAQAVTVRYIGQLWCARNIALGRYNLVDKERLQFENS